jgi:uncharacterized protein (DUF1330 family)
MNKGYWVVAYRSLSDESVFAAYGPLARQAIAEHGGSILSFRAGDAVKAHEAGLQQLTVVVEFPSIEQAQKAYASDVYQDALRALGSAAERDFRIVEGGA